MSIDFVVVLVNFCCNNVCFLTFCHHPLCVGWWFVKWYFCVCGDLFLFYMPTWLNLNLVLMGSALVCMCACMSAVFGGKSPPIGLKLSQMILMETFPETSEAFYVFGGRLLTGFKDETCVMWKLNVIGRKFKWFYNVLVIY